MDFPKSVPNAGLVNGRFVDENVGTGQPGSLIPAVWGNSVTLELLSVLNAGGIVPNELKTDQLAAAIANIVSSGVKDVLRSGVINSTPGTVFESKLTGTMGSLGGGARSAFTVSNGGAASASALMTFLRDGVYGFHLGIDTDNKFKRGGGSLLPNVYEIWDELSLPLATQIQAEAGVHAKSVMTPAAVSQAIAKQVVAASETAAGIAAIASQAVVNAGTDDQKVITAKKLHTRLTAWFAQATETVLGAVRLATQVQVANGVDDSSAVTPSKLKSLLDIRGLWYASKVMTDANAHSDTGIYSASGASGVPAGAYQVFNTRFGGDTRWISQLFLGVSANRAFFRSKGNYAGAETPMAELWHTTNMAMTGASMGFYRGTAPPGWLKENGAAVSRTVYADLFAVIGVGFGAGDGSTTFNLPDHRAEFPRGLDDGRGVNPGRTVGSTEGQSIQSHAHTILNKAASFGFSAAVGGNAPGQSTAGTTEATGGAETRPRNIAKLYCIKY